MAFVGITKLYELFPGMVESEIEKIMNFAPGTIVAVRKKEKVYTKNMAIAIIKMEKKLKEEKAAAEAAKVDEGPNIRRPTISPFL